MMIYEKKTVQTIIDGDVADVSVKMIQKEIRCDFTGKVVEYGSVSYSIDWNEYDPCFGNLDGEDALMDLFGVDVRDLMSQEYTYYSNSDGHCESYNMFKEILKYSSLEDTMRYFRAKAALKLINDGTIEPYQLNSESVWRER